MKYKNKGFTLVELIVVIVIILILSVVLVPSVYKYVNKASEATCAQNRKAIISQIGADYAEYMHAQDKNVFIASVDSIINKASCEYKLDNSRGKDANGTNIFDYLESGTPISLYCTQHGGNEVFRSVIPSTREANDILVDITSAVGDKKVYCTSSNSPQYEAIKKVLEDHDIYLGNGIKAVQGWAANNQPDMTFYDMDMDTIIAQKAGKDNGGMYCIKYKNGSYYLARTVRSTEAPASLSENGWIREYDYVGKFPAGINAYGSAYSSFEDALRELRKTQPNAFADYKID
ncbi:MAG: prepilin-type N-terminal cleavage/methylation domain-containing protein [Erysipelotrichaceae bacterium]|nr:prepilin-type N-terminal cleavage/methylation domain-containing protein [Erysipelotrichaceae bacterium]